MRSSAGTCDVDWTGEVFVRNAADVGERHCTMFHIGVECMSKLWGPNGGKSVSIPCSLISQKRSVTTVTPQFGFGVK
jgi:hypothetical protein